MIIEDLKKIYRYYGFESDDSFDNVSVFLYKKGRYFGADIIPMDETKSTASHAAEIRENYRKLEYAATIKNLKSIEEAEVELFKSFFGLNSSIERLKRKHKRFLNKETRSIGGNIYEYIRCPFEVYNDEIVQKGFIDTIKDLVFQNKGPQLIIIEAAAGFGKTCTAYELLNQIVNFDGLTKIPIFTELSRNRGANIFKYILLDEINSEFPTLDLELVTHEIRTGRIPLIIDGFDELLSKISLDSDISNLEEVEPMLNTIGELLVGDAKVILTTRKTAIFNGDEFDKWLGKFENSFNVTRISIKEPEMKSWLGQEKYEIVKAKDLEIQSIANPVLLSYLRHLDLDVFNSQFDEEGTLVAKYFESLLTREIERQNLLIDYQSQYTIFTNVVRLLLELDVTSESKEFFKEIIKDQNSKLLEKARLNYTDKPTIDELVDILANHALLDRKGNATNRIGFINDFILGTLIGEVLLDLESGINLENLSLSMVELAVTAFKSQTLDKKYKIWDAIAKSKLRISEYSRFNFDLILTCQLQKNYENLDVREMVFRKNDFGLTTIENTVFSNCSFYECSFCSNKLNKITFIDCSFEDCTSDMEYLENRDKKIMTINSLTRNCDFSINENEGNDYLQDLEEEFHHLEFTILLAMYVVGYKKKHRISSLIRTIDKSTKHFKTALNNLVVKDLIEVNGNNVYFRVNNIHKIKEILGK